MLKCAVLPMAHCSSRLLSGLTGRRSRGRPDRRILDAQLHVIADTEPSAIMLAGAVTVIQAVPTTVM
jgi:hypothetical protein